MFHATLRSLVSSTRSTPHSATDTPLGHAAPSGFARLGHGWRECAPPEWLAGWSPRALPLAGGATEIVEMGDGPPLVLLPPLPGFKEAWAAVAGLLARSFRVVTFDLRDTFPGEPEWGAVLGDLDAVVAATAGGEPVVLAGHSLGGALAQQWTLENPERVRGLVLSSTFTRVTDPWSNRFARYVEQPLVIASQRLLPRGAALAIARGCVRRGAWVYDARCDDRRLEFIRFCMRDCRMATARAALRLALTHDTRERLGAIRCPTLVVVGERESVFSRPAAEAVARAIPGADFAVSPGVSHLHPLTSPEWLASTIVEWWGRRFGA